MATCVYIYRTQQTVQFSLKYHQEEIVDLRRNIEFEKIITCFDIFLSGEKKKILPKKLKKMVLKMFEQPQHFLALKYDVVIYSNIKCSVVVEGKPNKKKLTRSFSDWIYTGEGGSTKLLQSNLL